MPRCGVCLWMSVSNRPNKIAAGMSIVINFLVSWTLLPLALPPFRSYSLRELIEVSPLARHGDGGMALGVGGRVGESAACTAQGRIW